MDDQIIKLAEETLDRYDALTEELSDPNIFSDQRRYREVAKEHARLRRGAELCQNLLDSVNEMREARELVPGAESAEEREFFAAEAHAAEERAEELAEEIRAEIIDRDPNDDKDVIFEIRAGAGGDEAALFAGELHDMYTRYADRLGFKPRTLASSPAEVGGYREVTVEIDGYRSSGPGGQSVNTTDSAVRITHKPTGLVVTCQNEKSQLQNKDQALRILRSRLLEREMRERREQEGAMRLAQVGTGDRSAKVRTYNFPQGRITDHRVGVTSHNLETVLNGELDEFTQALAAKERADRLAAEAAGTPR